MSANCAQADDTEILFESSASNELTPNVLFILDNSGSMSNQVVVEAPYDHTIDYTQKAIDEGYSVYSDTYIYVYNSNYQYRGRILTSQVHCQTMRDKLAAAGQYTAAKVAGFSTSSNAWENLFGNWWWWWGGSTAENTNITECKDDRGIHGQNGTSSKTYAINKAAKWSNGSNNEVSWDSYSTFDFFSANYQNWYQYFRVAATESRINIMKKVIANLVNSTSGINIGLMSFNTNNYGRQGGRVTTPIGYIEDVRTDFINDLNSLNPDTWTPLAETLFEAHRYYSGGNVFLGSQSVAASKDPSNASKYQSPISDECQPNNIVLLTDGEPTYDAHASGNYNSDDISSRSTIQNTVGSCSGNCLDEIARYMHENDQSALAGEQTVNTFTIGFDFEAELLRLTAEGNDQHAGGGGKYYEADDTTELESALKSIFSSLKDISTTFVSPGVAVNTFNRLNHRDELYFSVFKPESGPVWSGNLKRYRLGTDGVVYDKAGRPAIDPETGFFKPESSNASDPGAWSWWSDSIDANNIHLGGAAENLPDVDSNRNVYTYLDGTSNVLSNSVNHISYANATNLTKELLNYPDADAAQHEQLINWIRGQDTFDSNGNGSITDTRHSIMDPLHSPPVVVIYGGTDDDPDTTVFFGDNQGFLHAINGRAGTSGTYTQSEGEEYFAFMPKELLPNQRVFMENSQAVEHIYGMDGAISVWAHDDNNDNDLYDADDFAYLYSGMRRGGNSYYALDVTDRANPKFMWQITGGADGTNGFEELGQTWSKPVKTKVRMGKTVRDVLIFAGGYDTKQDTNLTRTEDTIGRAIFIVDAVTGEKIWSASPDTFAQMKYSIPSNVKAIDVNSDRIADQIYVGDMGGQVWRFDIDNEQSTNSGIVVHGGVIASLSGTTAQDNRRFYHAPDVSVLKEGGRSNLAIVVGSGWQAHPLDTTIEDRLYMIKSSDVLEPPRNLEGVVEYVTLVEDDDLYDATENKLGAVSGENSNAEREQAHKDYYGYIDEETGEYYPPMNGWYIRFTNTGEKSLASTLTVDGEVYYTTYEPTPTTIGCIYSAGIPRLYHINLLDATPIKNYLDLNQDTKLTAAHRENSTLTTQSLPTAPQLLRVDGKDQLCIGTECGSLERETSITRTYWVQEE
jgi:type IV pilus assembly protein PilY1